MSDSKGYQDWLELTVRTERLEKAVKGLAALALLLSVVTLALVNRGPVTRYVEAPVTRFHVLPATVTGLPRFVDGGLIRAEDFNRIVEAIEELQRKAGSAHAVLEFDQGIGMQRAILPVTYVNSDVASNPLSVGGTHLTTSSVTGTALDGFASSHRHMCSREWESYTRRGLTR